MNGIYLQPVYVYYAGNGTTRYFTAKNDTTAKDFLFNEFGKKTEGGAFVTIVLIQATNPFWLRNGIDLANTNDLLS